MVNMTYISLYIYISSMRDDNKYVLEVLKYDVALSIKMSTVCLSAFDLLPKLCHGTECTKNARCSAEAILIKIVLGAQIR